MIPFAAKPLRCIVGGEENPKIAPSPWDFVTLPQEARATAIENMHKNGKDRACGSGDMLADRQTHRQTCSSQYFATALAGEVIIVSLTGSSISSSVYKTLCVRHISLYLHGGVSECKHLFSIIQLPLTDCTVSQAKTLHAQSSSA